MKEYIERAALKRELAPYEENDFSQQMDVILAIVDAQPAADVAEVRHGRWIVFDPKNAESKECSMCGYLFSRLYPSNYCPNCGAPMTDEAVEMVMERLEALHEVVE